MITDSFYHLQAVTGLLEAIERGQQNVNRVLKMQKGSYHPKDSARKLIICREVTKPGFFKANMCLQLLRRKSRVYRYRLSKCQSGAAGSRFLDRKKYPFCGLLRKNRSSKNSIHFGIEIHLIDDIIKVDSITIIAFLKERYQVCQ